MYNNLLMEIDYRERMIIKYLEEYKPDINYKIVNLVIGDIVIKNNDCILYIIERKTINDLAASIIDGRFREQKSRLLETMGGFDKIMYILEGKKELNHGAISKSTINSSILNLVIKHQYKVLYSMDDMDTCEILLLLYDKLLNEKFEHGVETPIKLIKKSQVIKNNGYINMLCIIPGVSITIAKKIEENYNTLPLLIDGYNKLVNIEDREKLLSNIKINNKRKLGVILSKNIYKFLFLDNKTENEDKCLLD